MSEKLSDISKNLKGMVANQEAQIRVVVQTGYDEAGLVATADGYLRLAQVLIEFVLKAKAQETESWDIYGRSLPGSPAIGNLFGECDEVQIDSVMLAETEEEVNEVADAFLLGSPPQ